MSCAVTFRPFLRSDRARCLALFDSNCPDYFAPNERVEYARFLECLPDGYEVCEAAGRVVGAYGLILDENDDAHLNWILLDPAAQGRGIGSAIMARVVARGRALRVRQVGIAASDRSASFFARFGAIPGKRTLDGWGPGMSRVDMLLPIQGASEA